MQQHWNHSIFGPRYFFSFQILKCIVSIFENQQPFISSPCKSMPGLSLRCSVAVPGFDIQMVAAIPVVLGHTSHISCAPQLPHLLPNSAVAVKFPYQKSLKRFQSLPNSLAWSDAKGFNESTQEIFHPTRKSTIHQRQPGAQASGLSLQLCFMRLQSLKRANVSCGSTVTELMDHLACKLWFWMKGVKIRI